ncbi:MAG TPA: hypothetical protein VN476_15615, partial [Pyrinomonadaceae bacterium]|nr:hypothetical protein [Pyrinomonadaceae bacterium]
PSLFSPGTVGGLRTNDVFPANPMVFSDPPNGARGPMVLFEGELTSSQVLVVIPTIIEQDGPDDLLISISRIFNPVLDLGARSVPFAPLPEHPGLLGRILATQGNPSGNEVQLGIFGDPHDRPIGMTLGRNNYFFLPQRLRFTLADAIQATRTRFNGYDPGVIPITYKDAPALEGQYLIFVQIQRL